MPGSLAASLGGLRPKICLKLDLNCLLIIKMNLINSDSDYINKFEIDQKRSKNRLIVIKFDQKS